MFNEFSDAKHGVACLLIKQETGQIYLSQRLGKYENGKFACPGGMVEGHEFYIDSIMRELKEETGLELNSNRFFKSIISTHIGGKSDYTHWFYVKLYGVEIPQNKEPDKHGPWKLYTLNETKLLSLMVSTAEMLKELESSINTIENMNKIYTWKNEDEIIEMLTLYKNGVKFERQYSCGTDKTIWYDVEDKTLCKWNYEYKYRVKQEEKKSKLIPFTRETIPLRAIFRGRIDENFPWNALVSTKKNNVVFMGTGDITYEVLAQNWVYSLDDGKTWNPCGTIEK